MMIMTTRDSIYKYIGGTVNYISPNVDYSDNPFRKIMKF